MSDAILEYGTTRTPNPTADDVQKAVLASTGVVAVNIDGQTLTYCIVATMMPMLEYRAFPGDKVQYAAQISPAEAIQVLTAFAARDPAWRGNYRWKTKGPLGCVTSTGRTLLILLAAYILLRLLMA